MKKHSMIIFLFLMGCASNSLINYDNTNPVKVEQATKGLEITDVLPPSKNINGTIALRSIEYQASGSHLDAGVLYMIEDNLISSLIKNNYRVVERDPEGLQVLHQESTKNYRTYNDQYGENYNADEVTVTINGETIVKQIDTETSAITNRFYENEFFDTNLEASDYILSYRVLECGVVYSDYKSDKNSKMNVKFKTNPADMLKIERSARTRLHVRLTNSKTSEIIAAGMLENEVVDIIEKDDLEDLKQMSYNYYHHTLPLQNQLKQYGFNEDSGYAKANQNSKIEKSKEPSRKPKLNKAVVYILGLLAFFALVSDNN